MEQIQHFTNTKQSEENTYQKKVIVLTRLASLNRKYLGKDRKQRPDTTFCFVNLLINKHSKS